MKLSLSEADHIRICIRFHNPPRHNAHYRNELMTDCNGSHPHPAIVNYSKRSASNQLQTGLVLNRNYCVAYIPFDSLNQNSVGYSLLTSAVLNN